MSQAVPPNPRAAIVAEWATKAQADLDLAEREFAYSGSRNLDAIGFHFQQAIEKLMKSVLIHRGVTPPKTHDLEVLDRSLIALGIGSVAGAADLARLSMAAVHARYPGNSVSPADAADIQRISRAIWRVLRPMV